MEGSHDTIIAPAEWQMVQLEMERRQCNARFKGGSKCTTPHLYEQRIQDLFLEAVSSEMEVTAGLSKTEELPVDFNEKLLKPEAAGVSGLCQMLPTAFMCVEISR